MKRSTPQNSPAEIAKQAIELEKRVNLESIKAFQQLTKGKKLVCGDFSLGKISSLIATGLQILDRNNLQEVSEIILKDYFDNNLPKSSLEIIQLYFGVQLIRCSITDPNLEAIDNADAFIGSGSPLNITTGKTNPDINADPALEFTHGQGLKVASEMYKKARDNKLPVTGFCYTHQLVADQNEGEVGQIGQFLKGEDGTKPTSNILDELAEIEGATTIFHGDLVTKVHPEKTISTHTSADGERNHGLIHLATPHFTRDKTANRDALIREMNKGEHAALTFQFHPEYDGPIGLLVMLAIDGNIENFFSELKKHGDESKPRIAKAKTRNAITSFLAHHKNFK